MILRHCSIVRSEIRSRVTFLRRQATIRRDAFIGLFARTAKASLLIGQEFSRTHGSLHQLVQTFHHFRLRHNEAMQARDLVINCSETLHLICVLPARPRSERELGRGHKRRRTVAAAREEVHSGVDHREAAGSGSGIVVPTQQRAAN